MISRFKIEQVVVTFSTAPDEVLLRIVRRCEDLGIPTAIVPRLFERMPALTQMEHLGGLPLVAPAAEPTGWQFRVKYAFDRALGDSHPPPVSDPHRGRPRRARVDGTARVLPAAAHRSRRTPFEMLKFRSRWPASRRSRRRRRGISGPVGWRGWTAGRVGAFLRATSIDELPQLFNVLRGDMSIIGPRPERPEFVEDFEQRICRYRERHRVKSGITGWAQVNGLRGRTSLADRAEWDNFYIENFSLWLDLKIALMTVRTMFRSTATVE